MMLYLVMLSLWLVIVFESTNLAHRIMVEFDL